MGRRNFHFQIERKRRVVAKKKRDANKLNRAKKGPTAGAKLAAKMHSKTAV